MKQWMQRHLTLRHWFSYIHYRVHFATYGCPLSRWDLYTHNEKTMPFMDGETLTKFEVWWKILQMLCKIWGWLIKLSLMLLPQGLNMIQIKNKFNESETAFWKVYQRKYVGAQFVPRWSLVNVEIIYSQVVKKGEAMPKLEWTRGHKWSINVSRKGDHHCLTWARNSRKKWHFFYKNPKARVELIKAKLF